MTMPMVRRVITASNSQGRSHFSSDEACPATLVTPMFSAADIWTIAARPADVRAEDASSGAVVLEPPPTGLVVRKAIFHPDRLWKESADYELALAAAGGAGSHVGSEASDGMHITHTVDVAYVISGEIVAILEDGEKTLREGDSLIQRGTRHAWSNRTDRDAVVLFTQVSTLA